MTLGFRPSSAALARTAARYLLAHPLQSFLMLLGITLGVAVAVSVDVANASAEKAFALSNEVVSGRATHSISGGPSGLDETLYTELRLDSQFSADIAPIISRFVRSPQLEDQTLQLLGVDPFAEPPFRSYFDSRNQSVAPQAIAAFLARPGAILLSRELAEANNLDSGDAIELVANGQSYSAFVAGLVDAQDALSARALENLILADVSTAQELGGQLGALERIDLILSEENLDEELSYLKALLPDSAVILQAEGRAHGVEQLSAAFRTNLTAFSLLGLLVGLFLIYNTMTFSVIQRRKSFGSLRALGVTSGEIFRLVIGEAVLVGLLGSALGISLGVVLGKGAVNLVSQTINDLFFTLTVREASIPAQSLVKGGLLGMIATVLATIPAAREASQAPVREILF